MTLLTEFFRAFWVGGLFCLAGQLLLDVAKMTPAHALSLLVCLGSLLGALGAYPALVEFAGFGAALPISSFGNALVQGALSGARSGGLVGLFSGALSQVSAGIAAAVLFGFFAALLGKARL
ncbi:MAG: SpoVA/SpoVAEb family sporulation membrane protein [Firmicutes bacterium]|nr:SpoVA/SpoVAEb family sporulation membrane protein [Bacillota bacterium]